MIPASCKESVPFTDEESGIKYRFKPKDGVLDRRVINAALGKLPVLEAADTLDSIIDEIILGWEDIKKVGLPAFGVTKPSDIFNSSEKWEIIGFWNEANSLKTEQKKT